ncbi:hypothetical protein LCGC14_1285770 [marine sediment metagenome]|uniref:Uncharacterized protein n=1 Tax=marine sediment metagenome TaxID=412755 RepID=A0A0F9NWZ7_9ZZZZ
MKYRKLTLRRMSPLARDLAKLVNTLDSCTTRLANFQAKLASFETHARLMGAEIDQCPSNPQFHSVSISTLSDP